MSMLKKLLFATTLTTVFSLPAFAADAPAMTSNDGQDKNKMERHHERQERREERKEKREHRRHEERRDEGKDRR